MCTADILPQQVPSEEDGGGMIFDFLVNSIYTEFSRQKAESGLVTVRFLLPHRTNVTGPPGALLFDRDQRSHRKNHFNCSFVRVAA